MCTCGTTVFNVDGWEAGRGEAAGFGVSVVLPVGVRRLVINARVDGLFSSICRSCYGSYVTP